MKKLSCIVFAVIMFTSTAIAWTGGYQGGYKGGFAKSADHYKAQCDAGYGHFPQGLTFYKDFTKIPAGTYSGTSHSSWLNADYSIGSPVATFTSTSGSFTITSNGYNATTANDEVLKYLIDKNRTADVETIIIKLTPSTSDFENDGNQRTLIDSDTKKRIIYKATTVANTAFRPNSTDSSACAPQTTTALLSGTTYVVSGVAYGPTADVNAEFYLNGVSKQTDSDNYTTPAWGTSFYVGAGNGSDTQLNGAIEKIWIYSRALSASEVLVHNNL